MGMLELAFSGDPFECFFRVLDPVLVVGAVGRKKLDHLIRAVGDHVA